MKYVMEVGNTHQTAFNRKFHNRFGTESLLEDCPKNFGEKGYLTLPNFFNITEVNDIRQEIASILALKPHPQNVFFGKKEGIFGLNRIEKVNEFIFKLQRSDKLLKTAAALLSKAAVSLHVEYFAKLPYS